MSKKISDLTTTTVTDETTYIPVISGDPLRNSKIAVDSIIDPLLVDISTLSQNVSDLIAYNEEISNNYILVKGKGTPTQNGAELLDAYNRASKTIYSPSSVNVITIVVYPGYYTTATVLIMDTEYVNIVSLTGKADIILDTIQPLSLYQSAGVTDSNFSAGIIVNQKNVLVSGIKTSKSFIVGSIGNTGDNYINEVDTTTITKNCTGDEGSFQSVLTSKLDGVSSHKAFDCIGVDYCFGAHTSNGEYYNCTSSQNSFGSNNSLGIYHDCTSGNYSFGNAQGAGDSDGLYVNCISGLFSFGANASGSYFNCTGGSGSFEPTPSGTFIRCTSTNGFGSSLVAYAYPTAVAHYCKNTSYGFTAFNSVLYCINDMAPVATILEDSGTTI